MSKYTEISKRIGWEGYCTIPSPKTAMELHDAVVNQHCASSFELVFKIHRFTPSTSDELKIKAMQIINEAFSAGTKIFTQL